MASTLPFNLPFTEAADYFARKVPLTTEEFDALSAAEKTRAFTMATMTRVEMLQDALDATLDLIDEGKTLADLLGSFDEIMATRGWTGTTPWHAENAMRTNVQQSYGSGRLDQQRAQADDFPYWIFRAVLDGRTTDECEQLNGTVFSIDDVEWYPPIWYECRSSGEPATAAEAEEAGGPTDGDGLPESNGFAGPGAGDYEPDFEGIDESIAADARAELDAFDPDSVED